MRVARHRVRWSFGLIAAGFAGPAAGGPLVDCCSQTGVFCSLNWVGGAAACTAAGGTLFQANACTSVPECGVAHQAVAKVKVTVEIPPGNTPQVGELEGPADLIPVELIELHLSGTSPSGPSSLDDSPTQPSPGGLVPPNSFPATSHFDLYYELQIPEIGFSGSNQLSQRIEATVLSFPEFGVPYLSTGPVTLFDGGGQPVGLVQSLEVTFFPLPAPVPSLAPWAVGVAAALVLAVVADLMRRSARRSEAGRRASP